MKQSDNRRSAVLVIKSVAWIVVTACIVGYDGAMLESDHSVVHVAEAITGRLEAVGGKSGDETCTPFVLASYDRAASMASAMIFASAFEACVRERAAQYHISCSLDPVWSWSINTQVNRLMSALRHGNHLRVYCDPSGGDSAPLGSLTHWGADDNAWHAVGRGWYLDHFDKETQPGGTWTFPNQNSAPWLYHVDVMLHEFSHNHGYDHAAHDCFLDVNACTDYPGTNGCGWTTLCGGTGVPPDTTYGWADGGGRNRCAYEAGLGENGYDVSNGDPSFPYIISDCAAQFLEESQDECGDIFSSSCGVDAFLLLSTWTQATHDFGGTCTCYPSTRHRVAFRTGSGNYLQAYDGGGGAFTAEGIAHGPWQTFYLQDINGGYLMHNDLVYLHTWAMSDTAGYFVRAGATSGSVMTATATSQTPHPFFPRRARTLFRIERMVGPGYILNNETIYLYNVDRARYVTALNNGGSTAVSDQTVPQQWERFTYQEPRRALLVNIRAQDGNYVTYNSALSVELTTAPLAPELDSLGYQQLEARQQTFWLIDHNGGSLMSGDSVSFESSVEPAHWSSCVSGTSGNLRGNAVYSSYHCQKFRIDRVGEGSGPIRHRENVTFFSGDNRYVNAFPADYPPYAFHLRNEATSIGPWEVFRLDFAQGRVNSSCPSDPATHPYCNGVIPRFGGE